MPSSMRVIAYSRFPYKPLEAERGQLCQIRTLTRRSCLPDRDLIPGAGSTLPRRRSAKYGLIGVCRVGVRLFRRLLPDAEVAEDYVEQIFDVDGTGDAAEAAQGKAEIFGAQFGQGRGERPLQ
jgi:hypothetical protein